MPELKKSFRIGREILADLRGCDPRVIDDEQLLRRLVQEAIKKTIAQFPDAIALSEWTGDRWQEISYHGLFQRAQMCAIHADRVTIQPKDFHLVTYLMPSTYTLYA